MENKSPKTILLQGEPGSGKSKMAGETAVNKPVHFLDIDRKIQSAGWAQPLLASGDLSYWELKEPIDDTNLLARINALATKGGLTSKGPTTAKGWELLAEYIYTLPKNEDSKKAGTWVVDSCTFMSEYLKTHIMKLSQRSKFTFDQWTALRVGWMDTVSVLRDIAKENGKDLILTVHERVKEEPGDRVTGVRMEAVKSGEEVSIQKTYVGTQDVAVWASIEGSYGDLIGASMDEYYHLYVKIVDEKPVWKCRVHPDGRRNLRTSFNVKESVFDPDFRKIWK